MNPSIYKINEGIRFYVFEHKADRETETRLVDRTSQLKSLQFRPSSDSHKNDPQYFHENFRICIFLIWVHFGYFYKKIDPRYLHKVFFIKGLSEILHHGHLTQRKELLSS